MDNPILIVLMRFMHVISAVLVVGGLACIVYCVRPSLRMLDESFRDAVYQLIVARFEKVVYLGIAGLIISGIFGWLRNAPMYKAIGPAGNALIGTKVLLAAIIFTIVFCRAAGLIKPARIWQVLCLHLALVVIVLGGVLYVMRMVYPQA
ncbi:MAG: hypothetical protein WD042_13660 [Phycisphaeraceae bacterium]